MKTTKIHKLNNKTNSIQKSTKKSTKTILKPSLLDEIKLGKQLGKGMMGTTFLATDKEGNKYAYKIEKILPKEVPKSLKSSFWRGNI